MKTVTNRTIAAYCLPQFAVAMENGTQRVKSAADLCTGTNDGDGVAEFLEQNISRKIWSR